MWVEGFETGVTPEKLLPLWQVMHPEVIRCNYRPCWPEGVRTLVAGRAIERGRNVVRRFANHAARAGVARGAARRDAHVNEGSPREAHKTLMAGGAIGHGGCASRCGRGLRQTGVTPEKLLPLWQVARPMWKQYVNAPK